LSASRRVPLWPFVVARVYVGLVFAVAGVRQLRDGAPWVTAGQRWSDAVRDQLTTWAPHAAAWYQPVLSSIWIPHAAAIASLVAWLHVVIGVALVLGVATRATALLGLLLLMQYMAAAGGRPYYPGPTAAYVALLLAVLLAGAGRLGGVDAVLARRWRTRQTARQGLPAVTEAGSINPTSVPGWCALPLRLYLGAAFLYAASNKVGTGKWENWPGAMAHFITSQLPDASVFYRPMLTGVILPHADFFAPLVAVTEVVVGIALLVGGATRLAAVVGMLLVLNYFLMKGAPALGVSNDLAFLVGLLIVLSTRAGRSAGIDFLLARDWPGSPLW
jgi:uncharacterized membrane protein YphA (DoxX/SURF4 family)